ncbi:MAG TPA: hypothetical protein PLO23_10065, partial [Alphaproteobacteria bacterium]|nr:hypothetical protein [Alphaproteobacteria bacterium]
RGDIHAVKNEIPAAVPAGIIPNAVYFYTVTSKFPGSGPTMVQSVGAAHSAFLKATISPIREFTNGRDMEGFEFLPRSCRTRLVADYLAVRDGFSGMDSVAFFHMGNGAYAGCVQFNPGQPDDRVMMNYIYSNNEDAVRENQQIFKAGYVPMARELFEFVSPELKNRVAPVDAPLVAPNPAYGLGYEDLTP